MKKTCPVSGKEFEITDDDLKFYEKMGVPVPSLCPEERQRRRFSWRNERNLYKRICSATGKSIISIHKKDSIFPVYENKYWWSDQWNPLDYSQSFDFNYPFFEQIKTLFNRVPQIAIMNDNGIKSENCEYCQDFADGKNCYLVFESGDVQDSFYSNNCNHSRDLIDCDQVINSELAYESIVSQNLYNCVYCFQSENCSDCYFCSDLKDCKNCFGCVNLQQKEYWFRNESCTKEEYEQKIANIQLDKYSNFKDLRDDFFEFRKKLPHRFANFKNCESCKGNHIFNCKNVLGYGVFESKDSKFIINSDLISNSYDAQGWKFQWCVENLTSDNSFMTAYSAWCRNCKNVFYSDNCDYCNNCFGCVGLRKKEYCILNKQYTKEEYFILKDKIIEHMKQNHEWGEFFPTTNSVFGYNETVANEYYPLTRDEALNRGYNWNDNIQSSKYEGPSIEILDSIKDVDDSICNQILTCEKTGKNYKIIKPELEFYRKMNLPIPRLCPDARNLERIELRNPRKLWNRKCDNCGKGISTTFSPDRPEKIFCEKCYLEVLE